MNDRQIDKVLSAGALRQVQLMEKSLPLEDEINQVVSSQKFEQNMQVILAEGVKRQKKKQSRKRLGKIVASIVLVFTITFGAVMSADASRSSFLQLFERYFTVGSNSNTWDTEFNAQVAERVHDCYLPSWIPDGLQAVESSQTNQKCTIIYKNNDQELRFIQSGANVKIFSDSEISDMESLKSGGVTYYYTDKKRSNYVRRYVIWQNDNYSFRLESTLPKDDLLKIAEKLVYKKG